MSGCGNEETVETIEEREITQPVATAPAMPEEERFGFDEMEASGPGQAMGEAAEESDAPHYHWTTPAGWEELPPTSMRIANLLVAGNEKAECYFTILPGGGGGVAANVNRWREQMGLDPMSTSAIASLPRAKLMGLDAVFVEFDGVFTGMNETTEGEDFRMVGLVAEDQDRAYFVKMTGPQDLIAEEMHAFQEFVESLQPHTGSHDTEAPMTSQAEMSTDTDMALPEGHPPLDPASASADSSTPANQGATNGEDPSLVKWTAPEHWTRGADRAMRLVTYTVGESQCYVTLLGGNGGGVAPNINRWRGQMDQEPLSDAEIADLPSIPMLDEQAIYVEITGDYTGMTGPTQPDAMLLGAVLLLDENALFVLMTGPEEEVRGEIEHFKAFCQSFHW